MKTLSTEIKIDKSIPVPPPSKHGSHKYPFRIMKVGDSFLVPLADDAGGVRLRSSVGQFQRRDDEQRKFSVRKVDDGYRCWRTE